MSKHFKNKTPAQNARPMHYAGSSMNVHLPPAGIDAGMPSWHHPKGAKIQPGSYIHAPRPTFHPSLPDSAGKGPRKPAA